MPHPCCYMHVHQWMKCILGASGFMSNRGRQNVASFLALDMGLEAWPCCDRAVTDVSILLHFISWIWTYRAPEKCYESRVDLTQSLPHKQPMFNAFDFQQTSKSRFDSRQKHFRIGAKVLIGLRVFWWTMMWPRTGVPCLHDQHLNAFGCWLHYHNMNGTVQWDGWTSHSLLVSDVEGIGSMLRGWPLAE